LFVAVSTSFSFQGNATDPLKSKETIKNKKFRIPFSLIEESNPVNHHFTTPPYDANSQWLILDEHNTKIHEFNLDSLGPWQVKQWLVRANGHEWIVDNQLNILTPQHYQELERLGENFLLFTEAGKKGIMRVSGEVIIEPRYDNILKADNLFLAGKGSYNLLWKIFNHSGELVNPFLWQAVGRPQTNGYIPVKRNGYWGFIDSRGKQIMECVYDSVGTFVGSHVSVKFKGLNGILNDMDEWMVKPTSEDLIPLNERLYVAKKGTLTTVRNYESGTIYFTDNDIQMKTGYFIEKLKDGKYWKINYAGRILNSAENMVQYEEIRVPSEGLIAVKIHGRYGFIDDQERLRIANRYDDVQNFQEGHAAFKLMGRWGFINRAENIVVQPNYDGVEDFKEGLSIVKKNGKYGIIDFHGKEVVTLQYEAITRQDNGRFIVVKNGLKGLLNNQGRVIVSVRYETVKDLTDGQVIVGLYNKYGVVSREGDDLIPVIYDQITFDPFNGYYLAMKKK
jgi:hypothetical protein